MEFNIIATVGTAETELAPYPGGSATVPSDKTRRIYAAILTNTATSANTLTLRIYKDTTLETSFDITIPASSTMSILNRKDSPTLLVPGGRTLKAIASAASVKVLMACEDL
jgi:ribonucleotide monophosphatase NagD (HAD superfamily)